MGINKNFVVRNGLEVDNDLILADPNINRVGIGTTILTHTLTINGTISAIGASFSDVSVGSSINLQSLNADSGSINNLNIVNSNNSGVSTFNDITINGLLSAGSSEGVSGQYLVHTGTGVTWVSSNISQFIKTTDTQTASEGQTTFSTVYNDEYIDVYLNGVKLSSTEYTANDGLTVVLDTGAFAGDTIEFLSYNNIQTLATSSFNNINVSGIATIGNTVIGSGTTELIVDGDTRITGSVIAVDGFISVGNTTPINISLLGNQLTFSAAGIGSTTFTLS